jgi:competence protein ComEC
VNILPHHGSRTSSSAEILDAVQPRIALIQAGYRNRFGLPVPDVLERYGERGIALRISLACGAWIRTSTAAEQCQRDAVRRYWHHEGAQEPPAIAQ